MGWWSILHIKYCIIILAVANSAHAYDWRPLATGLAYARTEIETDTAPVTLHAFKINPAHYQFKLLTAQEIGQSNAFVDEFAQLKPLIALNAGFFSPDFKPLGLRIASGKITSPLKGISWWGIWLMEGDRAKIQLPSTFAPKPEMTLAVQSGPRLVVNGEIPKLKEGRDHRSAIGIQASGEIVMAIVTDGPISTTQLAQKMRLPKASGGLECVNALNLDGGSSSQLYAHVGNFTLRLNGLSPVVDAIGVFRK